MRRAALLVFATLFAAACSESSSAHHASPEPSALPTPPAPPSAMTGTLDLDVAFTANVELSVQGTALDARVTLSDGRGVAASGSELTGYGTVESFPEADGVLYTARFDEPAVLSGPCGKRPVSLALALYRAHGATNVAGSLTPYCGADTWYGIPARTPLRLIGDLPTQ
jgi:hypothetical protein